MKDVSQEFLEALYSQETEEGIRVFLTLGEGQFAGGPIRVVNSNETTIFSNGIAFAGFSFAIRIPDHPEQGNGRGYLQVSNVSTEVLAAVRSVFSVNMKLEIAKLSDPDDIELSLENLSLRNVRGNRLLVEADVVMFNDFSHLYPSGNFNPRQFVGMTRNL